MSSLLCHAECNFWFVLLAFHPFEIGSCRWLCFWELGGRFSSSVDFLVFQKWWLSYSIQPFAVWILLLGKEELLSSHSKQFQHLLRRFVPVQCHLSHLDQTQLSRAVATELWCCETLVAHHSAPSSPSLGFSFEASQYCSVPVMTRRSRSRSQLPSSRWCTEPRFARGRMCYSPTAKVASAVFLIPFEVLKRLLILILSNCWPLHLRCRYSTHKARPIWTAARVCHLHLFRSSSFPQIHFSIPQRPNWYSPDSSNSLRTSDSACSCWSRSNWYSNSMPCAHVYSVISSILTTLPPQWGDANSLSKFEFTCCEGRHYQNQWYSNSNPTLDWASSLSLWFVHQTLYLACPCLYPVLSTAEPETVNQWP